MRRGLLCVLTAGLLVSSVAGAAEGDPAWYEKKGTWRETVATSLDNKARGIAAASKQAQGPQVGGPTLFASPLVKGGQAPVKVSVSVAGQKDLVLIVTDGGDGENSDHSAWVDAKLIDAKGTVTWLDRIRPRRQTVAHHRFEAKSDDKKRPVVIGTQKFSRYIFAHAASTVHYEIHGKFARFEAMVGVDQRAHRNAGSVRFVVSIDPGRAPERRAGSSVLPVDPFWLALYRDFPARQQEIMAVRDWLRSDGIRVDDPDEKFRAPAAKALELAQATLAFVEKSARQPLLAAAVKVLSARHAEAKGGDWRELYLATRRLRRRIILSHPALGFEKILVNRNSPPRYSHNGDQHLGRHSRIGKGLAILTDWRTPEVKVTPVLKEGQLPPGSIRNPDLHYDAEKVAFAFCDHTRPGQKRYFLYEAALDGSWVRQLTGTRRDKLNTADGRATAIVEDNDPCYLPDDDSLVFISTRCQSYGRCHGGRYNPAWTLHRCDKNGDRITQLSYGNENEYEPSVLNDGRIVFTRWEYTNRHEMLFHMLWWCRPDGTYVSHYFGNDMLHPMMMVEASAIPRTHRVVTTAQGHHSYNTGTTVVLDTNIGENTEDAITHITPETPYSESPGGGWPSPHYSHPCAINEELFLASRANHNVHPQGRTPPPADRGIYLIDVAGGRELIYEDPEIATFSPIVIRKRMRPPVLSSTIRPGAPAEGTVYLQNAYLTRNDPDGVIKPGMIKALRVIAIGVQPRSRRTACSMYVPVEIPKKVLGTVPVDAAGSAYFKAPAHISLQIQTLDENGMAILTEKSLFYLQPGENRSCVGCHEPELSSPVPPSAANLGRLRPMAPTPAAGPKYPGGLSFMRTVQPVLDRYCISCHGLGADTSPQADKASKINLIHDGQTWPRGYKALTKLGDHRVGLKSYMGGNKNHSPTDRNISRPRRFFAFRNKVSHMLVANHGKCNMDRESYMRIIEWLDVNAQCYGDLFPNKLEERRIDPKAMKLLRAEVKVLFGEKLAAQEDRVLINPAQIDESRILMAPLAKPAGGWGQIPGYASKAAPKYKKIAALVDKCIVRRPNENTRGWQPTLEAGAGEGWVLSDREKFKAHLAEKAGAGSR